jgi:hypothetical protein
MWMAQVSHESVGLSAMGDFAGGWEYEGGVENLSNTQPATAQDSMDEVQFTSPAGSLRQPFPGRTTAPLRSRRRFSSKAVRMLRQSKRDNSIRPCSTGGQVGALSSSGVY